MLNGGERDRGRKPDDEPQIGDHACESRHDAEHEPERDIREVKPHCVENGEDEADDELTLDEGPEDIIEACQPLSDLIPVIAVDEEVEVFPDLIEVPEDVEGHDGDERDEGDRDEQGEKTGRRTDEDAPARPDRLEGNARDDGEILRNKIAHLA